MPSVQFRSRIRIHILLILVIGLTATASAADTTAIDERLPHALGQTSIPGLVAMAADKHGMIYRGAFGKRGVDDDQPLQEDAIFQIHSMTKVLTSVAVMQLVEQGRITLDSPAEKYAPELSDVRVINGFRNDRAPDFRAPTQRPSVRHLLTHTAGFGYTFWSARLSLLAEEQQLLEADLEGRKLATVLLFDPGTNWQYGISTDWLGVIVERVSGQSLEDYFQQNICEPLRLEDTSYHVPTDKHDRLVRYHQRNSFGSLEYRNTPGVSSGKVYSGGGGLFSTASDYIRILRMLLRGGELDGHRILRSTTVEEMGRSHTGAVNTRRMITQMPWLSNDFELFAGTPTKFGLGFLINTVPMAGGRSAGSLAWAGAANTYFWIDPQKEVCGVIMMQLLPFFDAEAVRLFETYERSLYSALGR